MLSRRLAIGVLIQLSTCHALAWDGTEHKDIGTAGYDQACRQVVAVFGQSDDASMQTRLHLACSGVGRPSNAATPTSYSYAALAGDWSRLAADHTESPEQLTSPRLGSLVVGYRRMTTLVINNYRHFQPSSVTSWRHDHAAALMLAAEASRERGVELAETFERALAVESFAQHYRQDSFASGHMGFNRLASSNATALAYHDRMSLQGRCVASDNGEAWYTYGDGQLWGVHIGREIFPQLAAAGRDHVMDASASSFYDFLSSFVSGKVDDTRWRDTWSKVPATFNPKSSSSGNCIYRAGWDSLREVGAPAPGASSLELFTVTDGSIYRYHAAARALMVGVSRDTGAPISVGYRQIHTRFFASIGGTIRQTGSRELYVDWGAAAEVASSAAGTFTHEVGVGQSYVYGPHNATYSSLHASSVRIFYGLRVEAGPVYVRVQTGIARSYGVNGAHVSTGIGWVVP